MTSSFKDLFGLRIGNTAMEKVAFNAKHPALPTALFSAIILAFSYYALVSQSYSIVGFILFFLLGVFIWTFLEYFLHRFIFHLTGVKEPWKTISSGLHLDHHRDPEDKFLIIASPVVAVGISGLLFTLFVLISGSYATAGILMSGIGFGYVVYEWVHYGTHRFKWKGPIGRYLTKNHLYHHFKRPNEAYGVTSPLWDHVFGTKRTL